MNAERDQTALELCSFFNKCTFYNLLVKVRKNIYIKQKEIYLESVNRFTFYKSGVLYTLILYSLEKDIILEMQIPFRLPHVGINIDMLTL